MSNLYEKLAKCRDENYAKIKTAKDYTEESILGESFVNILSILLKLHANAFSNTHQPDTLPNEFSISGVHFMNTEDFKKFMEDLGYDVDVELILYNSFSQTSDFKVTLISKK